MSDEGVRAIECQPRSDDVLGRLPDLPHLAPEGYNIDLPTGANALLEDIAGTIGKAYSSRSITGKPGKAWPSTPPRNRTSL